MIPKYVSSVLYSIGELPMRIPFGNYIESPNCGFLINYKATLDDDSKLPNFVTLLVVERMLVVQTKDTNLKGTSLSIKLKGTINDEAFHSIYQVFDIIFDLAIPPNLTAKENDTSNFEMPVLNVTDNTTNQTSNQANWGPKYNVLKS